MKKTILFILLLSSSLLLSQNIAIVPFATGFNNPIDIANAGDSRLFIVEQGGVIKVLNADGTTNATPFLNISTLISTGGERGLLGLAFHPNYATNGFFYVNYTNTAGNTVVARYSVSTNPDVANAASALTIITITQNASNHNGGCIKFGPDGYLYIGMGDGGGAGDTGNRAQNINELLGKMLRLDVDSGSPYAIPPDNPYAGATAGADEIWAIGLRNPWRFSFNRLNGDLWIADVGQNQVEEINRVSSTASGLNYGWRCYEGNSPYNTSGCAPMDTMTFPVAEYTHSGTGGCSITGGYAYTGSIPTLQGLYFFADYCLNRIGTVNASGTIAYSSTFSGSNLFTSFGEDINGELYITGTSQDIVYKITDADLSTNDFSRNGFKLYPNPAGSEVYLSNENGSILQRISIADMSGKLIREQEMENVPMHTFDISALETGLYLVTITDISGNRFTSKLNKK